MTEDDAYEPVGSDFLFQGLDAHEWDALAKYHERETWVWERVLEQELDLERKERYQRIVSAHQERGRACKEFGAAESLSQDEFNAAADAAERASNN